MSFAVVDLSERIYKDNYCLEWEFGSQPLSIPYLWTGSTYGSIYRYVLDFYKLFIYGGYWCVAVSIYNNPNYTVLVICNIKSTFSLNVIWWRVIELIKQKLL